MTQTSSARLAHYLVGPLVGYGTIGAVHQAYDLKQNRPVTLRIVFSRLAGHPRFRQRLLLLGQSAVHLQHPGIVPLYDVQSIGDHVVMVLAAMTAPSLGAALSVWETKRPIIALSDVLRLGAQVAAVLDYAHERSIVHYAVKPDNLFLCRRHNATSFRIMLSDFGLAALLSGVERARLRTLQRTLPYQSPEQVLVQPVDGRSDLYALGVILFQLVTGHLPFTLRRSGDAVLKHLHAVPRSPRVCHPGVPAPVNDLILHALAKRPQQRFQTGAEMVAAIRDCVQALTPEMVAVYKDGRLHLRLTQLIDGNRRPPLIT